MKKRIGIILLVLVLAAGAGAGIWYFKFRGNGSRASSDDAVFVDSVGAITGLSSVNGTLNRFSGVIEPQKTVKVQLASGMKVKETYVSVGQEVQVGTKLFAYDTEEAQDSITQLEIDIENEDISIESAQAQIKQLEKEREKVSGDEKLAYTTQIMTTENSIKRSEYTKKSKQAEMESLKKQIANAVVTSEQQGIIKSINDSQNTDSDSDLMDMTSSEDNSAFITIMATGEYRVKGKINEQNMAQIMEGAPVIVHSRVDESLTWRGTLTSIDKDNSSTNQSSGYYWGSSDSSLSNSSTYPFYVDLESSEGLMLGQHVYIVMDEGQEDERDGMWLYDAYLIADEEGSVTPYVWAAGKNDRLEKREVTLGEYDEELGQYEILDGLTVDDYIAFPDDGLEEGRAVTRNIDQVGGMNDGYEDDWGDTYMEGGSVDDWGDSYIDDSYEGGWDDEYLDGDSYEDDWDDEDIAGTIEGYSSDFLDNFNEEMMDDGDA